MNIMRTFLTTVDHGGGGQSHPAGVLSIRSITQNSGEFISKGEVADTDTGR